MTWWCLAVDNDGLTLAGLLLVLDGLHHALEVPEVGQGEEMPGIAVGDEGGDLGGSIGVRRQTDGQGVHVGSLLQRLGSGQYVLPAVGLTVSDDKGVVDGIISSTWNDEHIVRR